ncbi:hypothetical protein RRG08_049394 [Elysia crispata]|uniref:Uncharacterized protein n=1 Tax=Elysia crispata TaxID=231223 RepID=A0AAE0XEA2_9GAST|nr:hypothetical protein RRG08_049394 [Elysia crispata]
MVIQASDNPSFMMIQASDNPSFMVIQAADNPSFMVIQASDNPSFMMIQASDNPSFMVIGASDNLSFMVIQSYDNPSFMVIQAAVNPSFMVIQAADNLLESDEDRKDISELKRGWEIQGHRSRGSGESITRRENPSVAERGLEKERKKRRGQRVPAELMMMLARAGIVSSTLGPERYLRTHQTKLSWLPQASAHPTVAHHTRRSSHPRRICQRSRIKSLLVSWIDTAVRIAEIIRIGTKMSTAKSQRN